MKNRLAKGLLASGLMLLGLSGAMAQNTAIETNATTRLAQGRSPDSAVGRLLKSRQQQRF